MEQRKRVRLNWSPGRRGGEFRLNEKKERGGNNRQCRVNQNLNRRERIFNPWKKVVSEIRGGWALLNCNKEFVSEEVFLAPCYLGMSQSHSQPAYGTGIHLWTGKGRKT